MLELYHNNMSVCAQKVRFTLSEKGQGWTPHHLNLGAGEQKKPDYVKLNPNGVVPTLTHDGTVVIESTVIDEYLDDAFPEPPLKSKNPGERARMRLWTKQLDEGVHAATGTISISIAFRYNYITGKTPDEIEAILAKIADAGAREMRRENFLKGVDSKHLKAAVARYDRLLGDMERALGAGPWLAGQDFSLADIGYSPYITRLDHLDMRAFYESKGGNIAAWYDRIRKKKGYQEGLTKYFEEGQLKLLAEKGREAWPKVKAMLAG